MRSSGVLLPLFSLPSPYGIGSMGEEAKKFIDFLSKSEQSYWQVLPLGWTSFGDSPYAPVSTFAGGINYIDLDTLVSEGLLTYEEVHELITPNQNIDYALLYHTRTPLLKRAYERFKTKDQIAFITFVQENQDWLEDFSLFMSIKETLFGASFNVWPTDLMLHKKEAIAEFAKNNSELINFYRFTQYIFFKQWQSIIDYAHEKGIKIIGDAPIYMAYDSADVWSHPELFDLDERRVPKKVAGVPPDYFSSDGQLWGNPLYRYDVMKKDHYAWWINRLKHLGKMYDVIRLDHFRGFSGYWAIPYGDVNAKRGSWLKGPGIALFNQIKKELPHLELILEDLGILTPDVFALKKKVELPGMAVLQFGFGGEDSLHLPHNYVPLQVAYTGTHDNQTLRGWYEGLDYYTKQRVNHYLCIDQHQSFNDQAIKWLFASSADLVIIPLADWLNLGDEARINEPSTMGKNWQYRLNSYLLSEQIISKMREYTITYYRYRRK